MEFVLNEWPSGGIPNRIKTKVLTIYFYFIQSFFLQKKRKSGASFPASFSV